MPNTIDKWLTTARIDNPERKKFWVEATGSECVPIVSIIPEIHFVWGYELLCYLLDVAALRKEQQERLIAAFSERLMLSREFVEKELFGVGVAIDADDVEVMTTDPVLISGLVDMQGGDTVASALYDDALYEDWGL